MNARIDAEGYPVPTCAWHPEREPIAVCVHCGRPICRECARTAAEGYICRECEPAGGTPVAGMARLDALAAWARLSGWVGLVPLVGVPGALAAAVLAAAALRRARKGTAPVRPSPLISLALGLAGLAGSVVVVRLLWFG